MKAFTDKDVKSMIMVVAAILLSAIIAGQMAVTIMANDYKSRMIAHDYAIAGYLHQNDLAKPQLPYAFTVDKTTADFTAGQELLQTAGYGDTTPNSLIPEVIGFHQRSAVLVLVLSVVLAMAVLVVLFAFAFRQDKKLKEANNTVCRFMDGDTDVRLNDYEEGSLSRFFTSVNTMAASLTTYRAKEKQVKEFLQGAISDISHQLKTPLAALRMYNEIIQNEKTGNQAVDDFALKSERELDRMESLIQNLLKLARLDAGSVELEKSSHPLHVFLQEIISRFHTRALMEGKTIRLTCDKHMMNLDFDPEWLLEAVSNIVKNALDHTNTGDRVDVLCDESPVLTRITIKDNGSGIHPEDIHHIFKRFYRSRFSKDKQGVGIGLTLSKSIIEKHGGSITVESESDKGTTFQMVFPKVTNL